MVFLWTRREFGDFAAVMAAGLFTTLPIVLAFSGLAYTDLPTGCMRCRHFGIHHVAAEADPALEPGVGIGCRPCLSSETDHAVIPASRGGGNPID
jgi:hypothetical protein